MAEGVEYFPTDMKMGNGSTPLIYVPETPLSGTILCQLHNRREFVTWRVQFNPEKDHWVAEIGHYFMEDFTGAVEDLNKRAGVKV